VDAGLGPFALVRRSAPLRYVGVRPIDSSPVDGLLCRPTPGEIVEGGRLGRPCGPGAHSRAISETQLAATPPFPHFSIKEFSALAKLRMSIP
jgi:hypothetical protein